MSIEKLPTSASLKEVMDKFEEISFQDFSSIDVIVSTDLPSEVKEGRIICATDTFNNIYIQEDINSISPRENDIFIAMSSDTGKDFSIISKNKSLNTKVMYVRKYVNSSWVKIEGFIGINGTWKYIEPRLLEVYKNGVLDKDVGAVQGENLGKGNFSFSLGKSYITASVGGIDSGDEQGKGHIYTSKFIDMSSYDKLDVTLELKGEGYGSGWPTAYMEIRVINESGSVVANHRINSTKNTSSTYPYLEIVKGTHSLNVSSVNVRCSISIYMYSSTSVYGYYNSDVKIHDITLKSDM